MSDPLVERLRRALLLEGPTSAAVLISSLAVSQPTVSRLLARLGDDVLVVGRGRSTRARLHSGRCGEGRARQALRARTVSRF